MVGSARSQDNASYLTCRVCILPVYADDKVVSYYQNGGANAVAYRRIGKNIGSNRIERIQFPNNDVLQFGGKKPSTLVIKEKQLDKLV